ncbi:FAD-binding oxidoreductase [Aestuariicella sp. G3-2]|uniref:FAD-dependent oxidoreductase n=1 Tax=Pseudomaricurvus albidus TaxID=2842452 RepID=UPI001C0DD0D1|nr:FAD-dependent oxidoreductase [Aestuariicella albida]MBU3071662.1 FAD-binding oxidoreductase [Aestuariicella albida]
MDSSLKCDILIVGGGFYGAYIANYFSSLGKKVILCEKEYDLMQRASYNNQARVHNGYHYPRSVLTALRSRVSFPRFVSEFSNCIDKSFDKIYMIGQPLGKVTAQQFESFCKRVGAPLNPAPAFIDSLVNKKFIERSYSVTEYAFDSKKLKKTMKGRLDDSSVNLFFNAYVKKVLQDGSKLLSDVYVDDELVKVSSEQVFNCTYSSLNELNINSGEKVLPLKHEMTEMCLVDVPDELKSLGITVMCGPFFSVMPFPSTEYHSFSHVRYTPHFDWVDKNKCLNMFEVKNDVYQSAWKRMVKDAARYLPILEKSVYIKSLREVKTILPASEKNDSRPILFKDNYGQRGYHCLMGGKIDNIYDVIDVISSKGLDK